MGRTPAQRVAIVSSIVHAMIHSYMLLLPVLVPMLARRFGVSTLAVDTVGTAHYLAFGFGALPAGFLADRFGSRTLLLVCVGGCALFAGVAGAAPNFPVFAVGLIGLGVACSVYHPSGLSMISRATEPKALGRAIGIHGVGGNVGEASAPAAAALLAGALGWRSPFLLAAGSALLLVPLVASLGSARSGSDPANANVLEHENGPVPEAGRFHFSNRLILILTAALAAGFVYRGTTYFLPRLLASRVDSATFGVTPDALGGIVTSLALAVGVFSQWWGGRLTDRFPRERLLVLLTLIVLPLLVALSLTRGPALIAVAVAFGFVWYMAQPLTNSIAAQTVARRHHGILYGFQFSASFGLGSFAVSAGAGVAARWGLPAAFLMLAAIALANIGLAVGILRGQSES